MALMKDITKSWHDTFSVHRVFGDPIEKDGITVIPVAKVAGGGGGGSAPGESETDAENSGGGFGGMARPAGVYVIRADNVEWKPALDVTTIALAGIGLAALITVSLRKVFKHRR